MSTNVEARDRAWTEQICDGDESVFEAMVATYYEQLVRFAKCSLGPDRAEAADVVQDVLCRMWERRASWVLRGSLATYLHGAVRNRCVDHLRHRSIEDQWLRNAVIDRDVKAGGAGVPVQSNSRPDTLTEAAETQQTIPRAIARLPVRCRRALILQWLGGFSYAEIATTMGTSPNTVQIVRAHSALRAALTTAFVHRAATVGVSNTLSVTLRGPGREHPGSALTRTPREPHASAL